MNEIKWEIESSGEGKDKFFTNGCNIRLFVSENENKPNTEYDVKTFKLSQNEFFNIPKEELKSTIDELEKDLIKLGEIETITYFYNTNCIYSWLFSSGLLPSFCNASSFHNIILPSSYDSNSLNCLNTAKNFENSVECGSFCNVIDQDALNREEFVVGRAIGYFMSGLVYSGSSYDFQKCTAILSPFPRIHFTSMIYKEDDDSNNVTNNFIKSQNCFGPKNFLEDNKHAGIVAVFKEDSDKSVSKSFDSIKGYNLGIKESLKSINFTGKGNSCFLYAGVALIHHVKSIFGNNTWWECADTVLKDKRSNFDQLKSDDNYNFIAEAMMNLEDLRTEYQQYVEN